MSAFTPREVFVLFAGGGILFGAFVCIGAALYIAYTKMDLILDHLKNSSGVMALAALRQGGPWGNLLLVGGISGFVTFSGFYLKRGSVNPEDIRNFPASLKRKLVILHLSFIVVVSLLFLLGGFGKIVGWLK
ncbi:hypothetical protein [Pseudomonas sp. MWU13-2100]|uniref:hypothetical protein n=1 Tax=Pseudomonas sp. MWU13-2100 TaxID=2935075 RepID=UPI00201005D1|nr:hypothetical protein [Pseudomonas sp. MWU13-2100]